MRIKIWKEIAVYMKKYWGLILISLLLSGISVFFSLYIPIQIGKAMDCIIEKGHVEFTKIFIILKEMAIVVGISGIAQWIMNRCNNRITYGIIRDIRATAFEKLQKLPIGYIDKHPHGDVVSRMISDVDQLADGLLMGFTQLFTGVLTILGTLVFMISQSVLITIVVIFVTPASLFVAAYLAKRTHIYFESQSATRGEITSYIEEMIGNQKIVKAFGYEERSEDKFKKINKRLKDTSLQAIFYSSISNPATRFVNGLVYAGVGVVGAFGVINGGITVGQLTCFLTYANQYTKPFNEISGVITELQNALACAERILQLINEEPEPADTKEAITLTHADGRIGLHQVSFSYDHEKKLIENFNLEVKPGQRIAIVGPTGCGKTTLINLLMRFYDTDQGDIIISGNHIKSITRKSLRSNFGMVLQETWLRNGTIKENIIFGKQDATEAEIIQAAKASHAHSFIKRLPLGYDTIISEGGGNLSKGQKQLLCITRVMLCLPPMLILDEATSSIDTRTEMRIQKAFAKLMEGRTSFIVAHRLSTIQEVDVILVMKDGNVIEQGGHVELLEKRGFYYELYQSQFS